MIRKTKDLREALKAGNKEQVKNSLLKDYSFNTVIDTLADYLLTPQKVEYKTKKYKISKEDFETYFEIYEKRQYKKQTAPKKVNSK